MDSAHCLCLSRPCRLRLALSTALLPYLGLQQRPPSSQPILAPASSANVASLPALSTLPGAPTSPPPHTPIALLSLELPPSQANASGGEELRQSRRKLAALSAAQTAGAASAKHCHDEDDGGEASASARKQPRGKVTPTDPSSAVTAAVPYASSSNTVIAIAQDSSHPKWISDLLSLFQLEDFGAMWSRLLQEWLAIKAKGFPDKKKVSSTGRPEAVRLWIDRGCSVTYRPTIANLKAYERTFNTWWATLQPTWRIRNGEVAQDLVDGDWSCLRKGGVNGLQSVLAALFFWGIPVHRRAAPAQRAWNAAVEDCIRVFSQLSA
ncbi:hypothetical protein NLJ89_g11966 [Agrocybe chaxingu]|uniref:Uncharacterized protein n=1 Tax=Agrocybe chaxingu TaxID=84603 RepID=A0A9W8MPJ0_9AGAR|nr:hypothetical protein NLJ89_g11966 [Agrocybe chaxingu]